MRDEPPVETADIFIRNWRPSRWRNPLVFVGCALFWLGTCGAIFLLPDFAVRVWAIAIYVPSLLVSAILIASAVARSPIDRIRIGDGINAWPRGMYAPSRISHIELGPDPAEDYVEKPVPVPLCALTVAVHSAAPLKMIVSRGDALRLKEWAARHCVEVRDPLQSARLPEEPRSSF